jgi:hypothetical protein
MLKVIETQFKIPLPVVLNLLCAIIVSLIVSNGTVAFYVMAAENSASSAESLVEISQNKSCFIVTINEHINRIWYSNLFVEQSR